MILRFLVTLLLLICFFSCENKFQKITTQSGKIVSLSKAYYDVYAYNIPLKKVETTGLPLYQLGKIETGFFGVTDAEIAAQVSMESNNPTFGSFTQEKEDSADSDDSSSTINEEEIVQKATLHIPFFSDYKRNETTNAIIKDGEKNTYQVDSIYGDFDARFKIKVEQLTYFLNNIDVNNLTETKKYYSDEDYSNFKGRLLFDDEYRVDDSEILIYKDDDPDTSKDESKEISERLPPRIRLNLDKNFFQESILDKEGSDELKNSTAFSNYFRGLYISAYGYSNPILMLLDFSKSYVQIDYTYKHKNTKTKEIETKDKSFKINLNQTTINVFKNFGSSVSSIPSKETAKKIFQKSDQFLTEIKLFDKGKNSEVLEQLREKKWQILEANLTFHIDRASSDRLKNNIDPYRLYIYNLSKDREGFPLIDYSLDASTSSVTSRSKSVYRSKLIHSGILTRKDEEDGKYKVRITEHVNRILNRDSTNVRLGVMITSDITSAITKKAFDENNKEWVVPSRGIINPLGVVLHGSHSEVEESRRLRLEIYYKERE